MKSQINAFSSQNDQNGHINKFLTISIVRQVLRMFSAQSATFKDLLREQRRTYDNALMTVMNELLVALEESEVSLQSLYSKENPF